MWRARTAGARADGPDQRRTIDPKKEGVDFSRCARKQKKCCFFLWKTRMFYLDRVEPAKGGKRHKQEDGSRGPLGERVAFFGQFWIRSVWGDGSRLFSGHFFGSYAGGCTRTASEREREERALGFCEVR